MSRTPSWRWEGYRLVPLARAPASALVAFHVRNRERLRPFSPKRTEAFFTEAFWRGMKRRTRAAARADRAHRWVLRPEDDHADTVIGLIALDQIVRGAFQNASLGYSIDGEHEGRGVMKQAVSRVLDYAFGDLRLHRIAADHVPENDRSAALLASLGFELQGYARNYLQLDGVWRDHVLNAKLAPGASTEFKEPDTWI